MAEIAGKTIGELPLGGPLASGDLIEIQTAGGLSVRVPLSTLASYLLASTAIIPANLPWRGAKAVMATVMAITAPSVVVFNSEEIDTDNIWSFAAPSKLIVPTGVTKVRITARLEGQSSTGTFSMAATLYKNNAEVLRYVGQRSASITGGTTNNIAAFVTGVMSVVAGDEFELYAEGSFNSIAVGSFFEMEIVEYSA